MAKETINSQTLKVLRKQAKLSQQKLADISRVSKPTIARIEGGKPFANTTTIKRLATALGVKPEDLSDNPKKDMDSREKEPRVMGYTILKGLVQENTVISFHMVKQRYGFSVAQLVSLAPLFAALLAEGSLAWRKKKMEQAEHAIKDLEAADTGHRGFGVAAGIAQDDGGEEQISIDQGDIFGKVTYEYEFRRTDDWTDPFSCYLQHLAKDIGSQFINVIPHDSYGRYADREYFQDWTTDVHLGDHGGLEYHLDAMELERLTGGDLWAKKALCRSHVTVADIPEELKGDEAEAERVAWLVKHVPQSEIDEDNAIYAQLFNKINPSDKEDGSSKEEHSNDR